MVAPTITKIEHIYFTHEIQDLGADYNGFNQVYEKGATREMTSCIARVHTSEGIIGEHLGGT